MKIEDYETDEITLDQLEKAYKDATPDQHFKKLTNLWGFSLYYCDNFYRKFDIGKDGRYTTIPRKHLLSVEHVDYNGKHIAFTLLTDNDQEYYEKKTSELEQWLEENTNVTNMLQHMNTELASSLNKAQSQLKSSYKTIDKVDTIC